MRIAIIGSWGYPCVYSGYKTFVKEENTARFFVLLLFLSLIFLITLFLTSLN